ncbi:MAG: glycosyltransferase, partial [Solobacterium sp.]|nr:glycosyltransferase [Solobacterium sp.]
FRILAVAGQWYPEKGWNDLKRLAGMLGENERLIVVGVSAKQKREIEGERVTAIEYTDSIEALAELYSGADVLLNPTYEDTFPTVNIEAQACGCPVVTYRTGGSPEMLAEKTGIVVPRGDLQAMYRAVQDLKEHRILLNRDDAEANAQFYTRENMYEKYKRLYIKKSGAI